MSVINTNITSMIAQKNLGASQNSLTTAMERLSSGLRINSAKDDAAGQAIANRMTAQTRGLAQAQRNANDGISVAQTAEGALNQVNDNLQRIRELTVQSQNATNNKDDKASIQGEINQRLDEINRISKETNFNGVKVLNGEQTLNIQVGANDGESIKISLKEINAKTLGLDDFSVSDTKIQLSDSVARKSDVTTATNVDITNDAAFGGTFAAGFAADANAKTYLETSGATVTDTGDTTNVSGTSHAVYSVKIDGGDYFVALDTNAGNKINLLKQDGTGGYEKVTVKNAAGTDSDVQVAVFNGKLTAFTDSDGAGAGTAAQKVDLSKGVDGAKATTLLAKNDDNLMVNVGGKNLSVYEINDTDTASKKYGARAEDGTIYAVTVDATTGNAEVQKDADGNSVQYALLKDGNVAAVVNHDGKQYNVTAGAFGATATRTTEVDKDTLQTTGTVDPLAKLDAALKQVDELRSDLGAIQNRFNSAITNLKTNETNLSAAKSRIEDADYAVEVANMTRAQILQQAGTSVLAQANQIPQGVLSLLR